MDLSFLLSIVHAGVVSLHTTKIAISSKVYVNLVNGLVLQVAIKHCIFLEVPDSMSG